RLRHVLAAGGGLRGQRRGRRPGAGAGRGGGRRLLLAVDAAVFAAAGERQLFTAANWVWGTLGWFFVLAVWGRRVAALIALLSTHALIALVAVLGHGPGPATWPAT
ncbi:hypothetical protein JM949_30615, partial [Micromonospora sp. STR1s_6]|nr:hypothetical protein [Micromonospora tarensis]